MLITCWWYTYHSEKYEFVSWDDEIPNWMEKLKMFQTTNQYLINVNYPLGNVYITMENHNVLAGKIHYFDWAMFNSYVKLPEGRYDMILTQFLR